jgi:hypothetical protein
MFNVAAGILYSFQSIAPFFGSRIHQVPLFETMVCEAVVRVEHMLLPLLHRTEVSVGCAKWDEE